ncbi:MAG: hypothetical protein KDB00_26060 [Planctomycetales bacterium]|nr:hypothetical protein [Planctomycetales bacterium]
MRRFILLLSTTVLTAFNHSQSAAQDYHLVESSGVITADVYMRPGQMVVNDANGNQYVFDRDRSFDSYNGNFIGYWLPSLNRVVRFPRSGTGVMQVADLDDAFPRYVVSRRSVRPVAGHGNHHHGHGNAYLPPYFISPYGYPSYGYPGYGYGYQSFGTTLGVGPVNPIGPMPYRRPPMQSMVLDSRVVPRQPLPPVTVQLVNTSGREIRVTVTDRVQPDRSQRLPIPPGGSAALLVERDAGADRVQRILTFAQDGSQITREISTPIDPAPRYDIAVHEWRLQSVAIDRTGKSPNVIEDTQFQGRGIGRFQLPPGDQVTGGTLDVVRIALQAGNQGTVAPLIDDDRSASPLRPETPLEEMIRKQRESQRR